MEFLELNETQSGMVSCILCQTQERGCGCWGGCDCGCEESLWSLFVCVWVGVARWFIMSGRGCGGGGVTKEWGVALSNTLPPYSRLLV